MEQKVITAYSGLDTWIAENGIKKLLLVCGGSMRYIKALGAQLEALKRTGVELLEFRDFQVNPLYENVAAGVNVFREEHCDGIMAVGGGSAMDVAKCIKLYAAQPGDGAEGAWLEGEIIPSPIPFLALPTTAGSGSEATRYAVIYYKGAKQSVASGSILPDTVLLNPDALKTLPLYQRKSTMMDALCHALESFWSVNSTEESRRYSAEAIKLVLKHMDGYLGNTEAGNAGMLTAANTAGKAINITQTTAGHAMCYKITGLYKAAHGHAAILCNRKLFAWMLENTERCVDPRGQEYLNSTFQQIAVAMGCENAADAADKLEGIFDGLGLGVPAATAEEFAVLKSSVNPIRLKNHPIALDENTIDMLYHRILNGETR